jgi:LysW-gamma-L-alpha-aminoadipyl-6-phosphate/LysW-L-glutamyl-5-phosphate reductase
VSADSERRYRAVVYGATGFIGSELLRRLLLHPEVELVGAFAADHVGQALGAAHPNLEGQSDLVFQQVDAEAIPDADVVFLATPHAVSWQLVERLRGGQARIIDCSGAFRVNDPLDYERFYNAKHPLSELLPEFIYGLSELNREQIRGRRYVASPGCFATTIELGLLPLAQAGLLQGRVQVVGITGSSGAGSSPLPTTHHPVRAGNLRGYRPLSHPHSPEIRETLAQAGAQELEIEFVPVAAPLPRGILATSFVQIKGHWTQVALDALVDECYEDCRFIRRPKARLPEVVAVTGSNYAEVKLVPGDPPGSSTTVACISVLDNLVKGGAGQAIQNMNLMLNLDEALGLGDPGPYP